MVNTNLCPRTTKDFMKQIRADFTVCSLPADSLTGACISGAENEPDNCGFRSNAQAFCQYCAAASSNSTDSCCSNGHAPSRCQHVPVPTSTPTMPPLLPSSSPSPSSATPPHNNKHHGLSGGRIAGAVVGSVVGFAILVALALLLFICLRRRRRSASSVLNQPNPQRRGTPPMQQQYSALSQQEQQHQYQPPPGPPDLMMPPPGSRVARMSALRELPSRSPSRSPAAIYGDSLESSEVGGGGRGASPGAMSRKIPPITGRRHGSLSSNSALGGAGGFSESSDNYTPQSNNNNNQYYSSPEEYTSTSLSEQLADFKDYYSADYIHPGDKVSVLWAYEPRAGDEFELDRGEMLKVIGIWDDGWATGVRVASERAEDFDVNHREQRDSGVSSGSRRRQTSSSEESPVGEIKAFPLVCVCLPQHWAKLAEGGDDAGGGEDGDEYED